MRLFGISHGLSRLNVRRFNINARPLTASKLWINDRQLSTSSNLLGDGFPRTRNIGIIAHIDAGKTTTTERMLFYSGYTNRIGDVDEGSTVTDFLPAERARGITIQSAAITLHWPPSKSEINLPLSPDQPLSSVSHDINLIDTPGHADFTFEVLRSLRVLDGAVCILDGVAGVEAQTEIVWGQAGRYDIPRLMFINKLDRDGAAYARTVKEIAQKLHVWPALCQIPWWGGTGLSFSGVGDAIYLRGLSWESPGDGRKINVVPLSKLQEEDQKFAEELKKARIALVECLSEFDEAMVDDFLECDEDHLAISPQAIIRSLRTCSLQSPQRLVPVFAGASFRNIGVQPLLDAVVDLLPSPVQRADSKITIGEVKSQLGALMKGDIAKELESGSKRQRSKAVMSNLQACALAFKVVNDPKRGVLVYVRVYHGTLEHGAILFNTNLHLSERANKLVRMYASDTVDIDAIQTGHIGVIIGLKHARTGDTLITYQGMNAKDGPPVPLNTLQLQPIAVPPPVFYAGIEPTSLSEEKQVAAALDVLLREDPSLHVSTDPESGQTLLSGMGELHLEIACDRLIHDLKAKATIGKIQIGYREAISTPSSRKSAHINRETCGTMVRAGSLASVKPFSNKEDTGNTSDEYDTQKSTLDNNNILEIHFPLPQDSEANSADRIDGMPEHLSQTSVVTAVRSGVMAALAQGPKYHFPLHSTHIDVYVKPEEHFYDDTTTGAITLAARQSVQAAIAESNRAMAASLLEPVMLATISLKEHDMGAVVHDLTSSRGAQVLSLDEDDAATIESNRQMDEYSSRWDLSKVYYPPDPFSSQTGSGDLRNDEQRMRQITARVPLKEMVGYLKHLRSLTGGRGTFVMQFDSFDRVRGQRLKRALTDLQGV
jgi:elongation factor G